MTASSGGSISRLVARSRAADRGHIRIVAVLHSKPGCPAFPALLRPAIFLFAAVLPFISADHALSPACACN
jgi:hypothetical protein